MGMKFNSTKILAGIETRTSKSTQKEYKLAHFMNEDGTTFSTMLQCEMPEGVKQLDVVDVTFELNTGRYMQLNTLDLELAS